MKNHELFVILDFGGQVNQLVARRVRELNVYCQVYPATTPAAQIQALAPLGILVTGGSGNPDEKDAPQLDPQILSLGIPVLGIGYSARQIAHGAGAKLNPVNTMDQLVDCQLSTCGLFGELGTTNAWVGEYQEVTGLPPNFTTIGENCPETPLAFEDPQRKIFGLQFHPEISDTEGGVEILKNFLVGICGATQDWTMADYAETSVQAIRDQVGDGKVLLALSGGVDSSVVATLLEKAVGDQLYCIFVDTGLMRLNEGDEVEAVFGKSGMHFIRVDAEARFLAKLAGVTDPETKRKTIGEEFIRVFEEEAKKIGQVDFFAQGTIYPDVIESETLDGTVIKSHHNVGGLPDHVDFKEIIEPLRLLFKDEVRRLGAALSIPDYLVWRQPFPGPGLGIRVIGEITKEKLDLLRQADYIFRSEIANADLDRQINQYFVVLTNMRSVGVIGDERTYDYTMALRGVTTNDFMTARWARIPFEILERVSTRIVAEVPQVNRIVYDITSKPPATIEWE